MCNVSSENSYCFAIRGTKFQWLHIYTDITFTDDIQTVVIHSRGQLYGYKFGAIAVFHCSVIMYCFQKIGFRFRHISSAMYKI